MAKRDEKGRFLVGTEPGPGRTSRYDPAMNQQAYKLALLGLTDEEIAKFFDIHIDTLQQWKCDHIGFSEAIAEGGLIADSEVASSLYRRARGMAVLSERAFKNKEGEIVVAQTKTELPPDTRAAIHWLANRRRPRRHGLTWGPDSESAPDPTLPPGEDGDLNNLDNDALDARIAALEGKP